MVVSLSVDNGWSVLFLKCLKSIMPKFMENPNIAGLEYQRGTLLGFELREYLLQRDNHTCQYCGGASRDNILNIDHKHPRAKGGSDRLANLTLSCLSVMKIKTLHCSLIG